MGELFRMVQELGLRNDAPGYADFERFLRIMTLAEQYEASERQRLT